ncbi:MAG: YqaA family protein [Gulosibacter sp.]|uniref:YqaA family protein n=1 Tax=Gulosibacter sp. TaxID=2817531 RepID=UPI003F91B6BF
MKRAKPEIDIASNRRENLIAAAWGAAEATFFFIVPDVWITRVSLRSRKRGFATAMSALAGAVAGGIATYQWGKKIRPRESKRLLRKLPAISGEMIENAENDMQRTGNRGMLWGPFRGVPYKIFARTAGMQRLSFPSFVAWSIPARIPRFLLVVVATRGLVKLAGTFLPEAKVEKLAPTIHTVFWIAFYSWYMRVVGREK